MSGDHVKSDPIVGPVFKALKLAMIQDIVPSISTIIEEKKFVEIMKQLYAWEEEYFQKIKTHNQANARERQKAAAP